MSRQHQDSLRAQLIAALEHYPGRGMAQQIFDDSIWPILDAAIDAGELLVARNTVKQKPVHEAITAWLEVVGWTVQRIKGEEATISKASLLKYVYDLDENCARALAEAKAIKENDASFETPF